MLYKNLFWGPLKLIFMVHRNIFAGQIEAIISYTLELKMSTQNEAGLSYN